MPSLHELQRSFAAMLASGSWTGLAEHVHDGEFSARERLGIYRNSVRSTLAAALRLAYPAVARLVGAAFFEHAAGRYALEDAPASACLDEYGAQFPAFLEAFPGARDIAYLGDVARFEWALSRAAHAEDCAPLEASALAGVTSSGVRFVAHPSACLLRLRFPADRIADAVMSGDEDAMRRIDLAQGPVWLAVHRGRAGIEVERLDALDHEMLAALFAGEPWARLDERFPERAARVLAQQLVRGRLGGFRLADDAMEAA